MDFALPEFSEQLPVQPRRISFVEIKSVLRVLFVKTQHDAVAGDFGDDGGRGDCRNLFVALDDGLMRNVLRQYKPPIKQRPMHSHT